MINVKWVRMFSRKWPKFGLGAAKKLQEKTWRENFAYIMSKYISKKQY